MRSRTARCGVGSQLGKVKQELAADAGTAEEAQGTASVFVAVRAALRIFGQVLESKDVTHRGFRHHRRIVEGRSAGEFVVGGVQMQSRLGLRPQEGDAFQALMQGGQYQGELKRRASRSSQGSLPQVSTGSRAGFPGPGGSWRSEPSSSGDPVSRVSSTDRTRWLVAVWSRWCRRAPALRTRRR